MDKKTVDCPRCKGPVDVYAGLPIATCPNCGHIMSQPDPRRQEPPSGREQRPQ